QLSGRPRSQGFPPRSFRGYAMNSPQPHLDLLAARIQNLEAANHRWKFVNALLLLSGVSSLLMGAKPADRLQPNVIRAGSVEAQEFILKDETGHVYARLS